MERDIAIQLHEWKTSSRRKPLVLRGARQVGKTYLLKHFAKHEYASMVYLNFEADPLLSQLFAGKLDPTTLIRQISLYFNQPIDATETLLIFDEIQECPEALNSLKYFYEEAPEYHIVAAGSLLGVKLANTKGFPVGKVHFMDVYPLSFFEFLTALNRQDLRAFLESIKTSEKVPVPIHDELLDLLRRYFYLGGMPEVVADYVAHQDYQQARVIQQDILDAYLLDVAKHAKSTDVIKISDIWKKIPSQLAKENKKFIFSAISAGARGREYESALQWLTDAGLIYRSYNITKPSLPLSSYCENQAFKVFLLDVGLLGAMTGITADLLIRGHELFTEFKGSFTENFVAQTLMTQQPHNLYYWTSSGTAEVDFITSYQNEVFPLEVKAGGSTKHKSLRVYADKYAPKAITRANLLNLECAENFYNIPLYLVGRFPSLVWDQ
jgi:predicted AAA+ superfamily ATPase